MGTNDNGTDAIRVGDGYRRFSWLVKILAIQGDYALIEAWSDKKELTKYVVLKGIYLDDDGDLQWRENCAEFPCKGISPPSDTPLEALDKASRYMLKKVKPEEHTWFEYYLQVTYEADYHVDVVRLTSEREIPRDEFVDACMDANIESCMAFDEEERLMYPTKVTDDALARICKMLNVGYEYVDMDGEIEAQRDGERMFITV
jgi:hypothetical protein